MDTGMQTLFGSGCFAAMIGMAFVRVFIDA